MLNENTARNLVSMVSDQVDRKQDKNLQMTQRILYNRQHIKSNSYQQKKHNATYTSLTNREVRLNMKVMGYQYQSNAALKASILSRGDKAKKSQSKMPKHLRKFLKEQKSSIKSNKSTDLKNDESLPDIRMFGTPPSQDLEPLDEPEMSVNIVVMRP